MINSNPRLPHLPEREGNSIATLHRIQAYSEVVELRTVLTRAFYSFRDSIPRSGDVEPLPAYERGRFSHLLGDVPEYQLPANRLRGTLPTVLTIALTYYLNFTRAA